MAKTKDHQDRIEHESRQKGANQGERRGSQSMQTMGERGGRPQGAMTRREQYATSQLLSSPFTFMRRFGEEMDRLFEDFGMGRGLRAQMFGRELGRRGDMGDMGISMWSPQIEVFERGNQLVVRADLPGMTRDDINVEFTDDALVIRGERRSDEGVSAENANATFRNGVLEITMPAPQRAEQRRRLEIREGTEGEPKSRGQSKAAGQT